VVLIEWSNVGTVLDESWRSAGADVEDQWHGSGMLMEQWLSSSASTAEVVKQSCSSSGGVGLYQY